MPKSGHWRLAQLVTQSMADDVDGDKARQFAQEASKIVEMGSPTRRKA